MPMPLIAVNSLSFGYAPGSRALENIFLEVEEKSTWAIIGKNGSGKSTLLKCLCGLLRSRAGAITIQGKPLGSFRPRELAHLIAFVPQAHNRLLPPFSVRDFVMLGRFPFQGFFALPSGKDKTIVDAALQLTDTGALADRILTTLSGGELQRVFLASAVAQKTAILLLDEPMAFLDPMHQELIQRSIDRIHEEFSTTIIAVTHDVNHALNRFTHVCALSLGAPYYEGTCDNFKGSALRLLHDIYSIPFYEIRGHDNRHRYYLPESFLT
ncbi:MAG: ABC transporter ATP-binding protein [Chitinispirillaceae bacterium]